MLACIVSKLVCAMAVIPSKFSCILHMPRTIMVPRTSEATLEVADHTVLVSSRLFYSSLLLASLLASLPSLKLLLIMFFIFSQMGIRKEIT